MIRHAPFVPTGSDIKTLREDVLEAAYHGMKPLCMLDAFGMGYPIGSHEDFDHQAYPWHWASRYIVADEEGTVYWVHPTVRASLDTLTLADFQAEAQKSPWVKGNAKKAAQGMLGHYQDALAALDARMPPAQRLYAAIQARPAAATPQQAYQALLEAAADSGLPQKAAWDTITLALGIDPDACLPIGFGIAAHLHAVAACIPAHTPAPSPAAAKEAYLDIMPPYARSGHARMARHAALLTAAAALAHGIYPAPVRDLDRHPDYICARIARKRRAPDYNPRYERDPYTMLGEAIGTMIHTKTASSAEIADMITRANSDLAGIGVERALTRSICEDLHCRADAIPF